MPCAKNGTRCRDAKKNKTLFLTLRNTQSKESKPKTDFAVHSNICDDGDEEDDDDRDNKRHSQADIYIHTHMCVLI